MVPRCGSTVICNIWFSFHLLVKVTSYSVLNGCHGLILVARRAGSHVAEQCRGHQNHGAIVKAKGSVELTWKRIALTTFQFRARGENRRQLRRPTITKPSRKIIQRTGFCLAHQDHPDPDLALRRATIRFSRHNADDRQASASGAKN